MYTLDYRFWKEIQRIIHRYFGMSEWIKLFGSRSRDDARVTSDTDLAVASSIEVIT